MSTEEDQYGELVAIQENISTDNRDARVKLIIVSIIVLITVLITTTVVLIYLEARKYQNLVASGE